MLASTSSTRCESLRRDERTGKSNLANLLALLLIGWGWHWPLASTLLLSDKSIILPLSKVSNSQDFGESFRIVGGDISTNASPQTIYNFF